MIAYLIKSGLCLAFLLGVYLLLLEREKMHRFNRFFLMFALVFGLSVPLFTIDLGFEKAIPNFNWTEQPQTTVSSLDQTSMPVTNPQTKEWPVKEAGFILYGIVAAVLLIRFTRSLIGLIQNIRTSPQAYHHGSKLVLCKENVVPHSFMGFIFLNETKFRKGTIEEEIIEHERVHVQHMHSLDILFAELLKIVFWFNPIFYFYKKAIQLNHEFIADEIVTQQTRDISAYQKILLQHSSKHPSLVLASSFNYSLTKKRFIMMKKKTSLTSKLFKQLLLIPVFAISFIAFSNQAIAQENASFKLTDSSTLVPYLYIQSHPEKEQLALIQFKLNENAKVELTVHDTDNESSFNILERTVEKGRHEIAFDYSNLPEKNFDFNFNFKGEITINMSGSFILDGKLQTIGDTLSPPPAPPAPVPNIYPKSITDGEKAQIDQAREKYHQAYNEYMNLDPKTSSLNELQQAYKAVKASAENMGLVYKKIAGEDDEITPPLPIKIGPTPEKRKLLNSKEKAELREAIDKAIEIRQKALKNYLDMDAKTSTLEELQSAYKEMREKYKKAYEAQVAYYKALGKVAPPPPPIPPSPEKRKGIDN